MTFPIYINNHIRSYGSLSYGSIIGPLGALGLYEFPPTYTLSCTSKPVYAESGTVLKYVRNELTVTWVLPWDYTYPRVNPQSTPEGGPSPYSIDTAVQQIRAILMQPRKTLSCTYQGLGPSASTSFYGLVIDPTNDMNQGPEPLDFKWRNIATQRCAELTWVVAFYTPGQITFNSANTNLGPTTDFVELSWSRTYDLDEVGLVSITTTGRIEVRLGNNFTHVDQARWAAAFPVPLYCQRVSQRFQHEPNTRATRFTIVDKQFPIENPLPNGCIKIEMSHNVSSALFGGKMEGKGFHQWNNTIQASITLPPGVKPAMAYYLFWFYAKQRTHRVRANGVANGLVAPLIPEKSDDSGKATTTTQEQVRNIFTKVSYTENIFDRTHQFKLEYLGTYDKIKLLQQSGLFTPVYNYRQDSSGNPKDWFNFSQSDREPWNATFDRDPTQKNWLSTQWLTYRNDALKGNPNWTSNYGNWSVYGYTAATEGSVKPYIFIPEERVDVNAGVNNVNQLPFTTWGTSSDGAQGSDESAAKNEPDYGDLNPAETYVAYQVDFNFIEDHNTYQFTRQKYDDNIKYSLQSFKNQNQATFPNKFTKKFVVNNADAGSSYLPSDADITSGYNGQSNMMLVMSGYAVRVGFPPVIPSVLSYGTNAVYRAGRASYAVRQVANGDLPVYLAQWSIPYYIDTNIHANVFKNLNMNGFSGALS